MRNSIPMETKTDIEQVTITPKMAEAMLTKNHSNRTLRPSVIARYAHDMANGKWRLKGQAPILLDRQGNLVNGQHRLYACIQSGTAFEVYLVRDVDPEDVITTDSGLNRSLGDVLAWQGVHNPRQVAAAIRVGFLYERRLMERKSYGSNPSRSEAVEFLRSHPGLAESLDVTKDLSFKLRLSIGVAAYLHWYGMQRFPEKTQRFFHELRHGTELHEGNPVLALRHRLTERSLPVAGSLRIVMTAALMIKAFNAYIEDIGMTVARWSTKEAFPRLIGDEGYMPTRDQLLRRSQDPIGDAQLAILILNQLTETPGLSKRQLTEVIGHGSAAVYRVAARLIEEGQLETRLTKRERMGRAKQLVVSSYPGLYVVPDGSYE